MLQSTLPSRLLKEAAPCLRSGGLCLQIDMLHPGILGTYDEYGDMFCGNLVTMPGNRKEWKYASA